MRITKKNFFFIFLLFVIPYADNLYPQAKNSGNFHQPDKANSLYVLTNYTWDSRQWIFSNRYTYKYDEKGATTEQDVESYINGSWVSVQKYSYVYDLIGSTMFYINRSWENGLWVNKTRYSSNFLQPDTTESLTEIWNHDKWVNSSKSISINNQTAKISEYISMEWDSTKLIWINSQKSVSEFDSSGRTIKSVSSAWQDGWINLSQTIYVYDVNGNNTEGISQSWQYGAWVNSTRTLNKYDANRSIENIYQMWLGNDWVNIFRHSLKYNSGNRITEDLGDKWNLLSLVWESDTKLNYFYNSDGSMSETISCNWQNGIWVNNRKSVYSYQPLTTDFVSGAITDKDNFILFQNYPNPFNPTTAIHYFLLNEANVSLKIYDGLGREVRTLEKGNKKAGYHEVIFNASGYTSGVYYYVLRISNKDGGKILTKKMILLK